MWCQENGVCPHSERHLSADTVGVCHSSRHISADTVGVCHSSRHISYLVEKSAKIRHQPNPAAPLHTHHIWVRFTYSAVGGARRAPGRGHGPKNAFEVQSVPQKFRCQKNGWPKKAPNNWAPPTPRKLVLQFPPFSATSSLTILCVHHCDSGRR